MTTCLLPVAGLLTRPHEEPILEWVRSFGSGDQSSSPAVYLRT